jgi:hypothetical protein
VGAYLLRLAARCALVGLIPCAAVADSLPDTLGAPVSLNLELTGRVLPRCGFASAPTQSATLGDLGTAGSLALSFTLDCNAPFAMKVSSAHGALSHVGPVNASATFVTALDYTVDLSVDTDLAPVGGQCAASALASSTCAIGAGLSSGDGVAIGTGGSLTLGWAQPGTRPVAGSYQDSLVVTVEVRS